MARFLHARFLHARFLHARFLHARDSYKNLLDRFLEVCINMKEVTLVPFESPFDAESNDIKVSLI